MEAAIESGVQKIRNSSMRKKMVLIVDDSADLLELFKIVLEMDDYEVFTALSGESAFSVFTKIGQPDLILLDLQMADMSGSEFLVQLEEKQPEIFEKVPVVFLTGMGEIPESNAVGFIRKPIDNKRLLQAVHHFIEEGTGPSQHKH